MDKRIIKTVRGLLQAEDDAIEEFNTAFESGLVGEELEYLQIQFSDASSNVSRYIQNNFEEIFGEKLK